MNETVDSEIGVANLCYPELLSREELVNVLLSRCVRKQLLEGLEKSKLVDLFQRIVLPLPQRVYSNNRRGKILNALRTKMERRVKNGETETNADGRSVSVNSNSNRKINSPYEKHTASKSHDSLDHVIINDRRKKPKNDEEIRTKPVEAPKISHVDSKSNTVVKLKRTLTNSEALPMKGKEEGEEERKKKRRIVWP